MHGTISSVMFRSVSLNCLLVAYKAVVFFGVRCLDIIFNELDGTSIKDKFLGLSSVVCCPLCEVIIYILNIKKYRGKTVKPKRRKNNTPCTNKIGEKYRIIEKMQRKEKYYIVKNGTLTFGISIMRDQGMKRDIIKFGGKKACMNFHKYDDDAILYFNGLSYDEKCSLNDVFERKSGTTRMVKTALTFLCRRYRDITHAKFVDTSFIKCKRGKHLSLSALYLAKHGKTWYEKTFGAVAENEGRLEVLRDEINKQMTNPLTLDFTAFFKEWMGNIEWIREKKTTYTNLEIVYQHSETMREFVINVHEAFKDCIIFDGWLEYLVNKTSAFRLEREFNLEHEYFFIHRPTIETWKYKIEIEKTGKTTFENTTKEFFDVSKVKINGLELSGGDLDRGLPQEVAFDEDQDDDPCKRPYDV